MKILILTTDIFSKDGIQEYTNYLIKALKELYGCQNIYVASLLAEKHEKLRDWQRRLAGGSSCLIQWREILCE